MSQTTVTTPQNRRFEERLDKLPLQLALQIGKIDELKGRGTRYKKK